MDIAPIKLLRGNYNDTATTGIGCFMNVIAYLNGEPQITDQSECVCITVKPIAIFLNDFADDNQRQRMLPLVLRAMGSRTDDKAEISRRRALFIEFANWQGEYAAKYAKSAAKYAAKSAKYAAKSAAKSAEYAAKYAAYQTETFDRGIALLDAMLPKAQEADTVVIGRAQRLIELAMV